MPIRPRYLLGDEDEGMEEVVVKHNPAHTPLKRSNIGCYDDTSATMTNTSFMPLSDGEGDNDPNGLGNHSATLCDPETAYYNHFDTLDTVRTESKLSLSDAYSPDKLDEERKLLSSEGGETEYNRKSIKRSLTRYQYTIVATKDFKVKKTLIEEYELYKSKFDADNEEDAMRAKLYHDNAINNGYSNSPGKRIEYFQKAIAYTNNLTLKSEIKHEYKRYCYSLKNAKQEAI